MQTPNYQATFQIKRKIWPLCGCSAEFAIQDLLQFLLRPKAVHFTGPKQKVPLMKTHWRQPTQKNLGVHPNPKEEIKSSSIIIRIYHVAICLLPTRSNLSLLYIIFPSGLVLSFFLFKFLRFQVALHRSKQGLKQMSTHCWRVMVMDPQRRAKDVNTNHSNSTRWHLSIVILYIIYEMVVSKCFKYFLCSPPFGEDSHFDEHIFQMGGSIVVVFFCIIFVVCFFTPCNWCWTCGWCKENSSKIPNCHCRTGGV